MVSGHTYNGAKADNVGQLLIDVMNPVKPYSLSMVGTSTGMENGHSSTFGWCFMVFEDPENGNPSLPRTEPLQGTTRGGRVSLRVEGEGGPPLLGISHSTLADIPYSNHHHHHSPAPDHWKSCSASKWERYCVSDAANPSTSTSWKFLCRERERNRAFDEYSSLKFPSPILGG